ncbi:2OG-Fe(II) oxygenase [Legionella tunisiensis]|uniref:2OG-Fe(II) oxygenase n=1 Tax=Legionella tunisiensis TaxID=1034944 RepID=UPI002FBE2829
MLITTEQLEDEICRQGFHIIDNFLALEDYQTLRAIAEEMHNSGQFKSAKIGRQLETGFHSDIRNDKICWLDEESANQSIKIYFSKISRLAERLNQTLFLGLVDFETHFCYLSTRGFL